MNVIFETERLVHRRFTNEDAELIFRLNEDPEVIRYTLDPMVDILHAQQVLEDVILPQYRLYGFGRWAVHLKPDLRFIGWSGLKYRPERDEVDLGYRFMRPEWGKGYATESASAVLNQGFETFQLKRIVGRALPGNTGSIRVLEKIGMHFRCEEEIEGLLHRTYDAFNPLIR